MNMEQSTSTNKLGTMPMNRLILQMSIPLMISMILQAGYNLVDSMFVAALNEKALTAVSLSFPIQVAMIGLAVGTSGGVGAVTSRRLGEKNRESASNTAKIGFILSIISWLLMAAFVFFMADRFVHSQTQDTKVIRYATEYLKICGIINIGVFQQILMEKLLQATGKTVLSMICQIVGVIGNIILDPILIFGLFGAPRLEVLGAAIATVCGQLLGMAVGIILNLFYNKELQLSFKKFHFDFTTVKEIYKIGIPSIVIQVIASFMVFMVNKILFGITDTAVALFGAYFKLNGFLFMPIFAVYSGLTPVISYNFGAGNSRRIKEAVQVGCKIAVLIMAVGTLIFQLFPTTLLMMFKPSLEFLEIGVPALRIMSLVFTMAGYGIAMAALFQSVGRPYYSLIISVFRQGAVLLPIYFLGHKFGLYGVWWSFPLVELIAFGLTIIFYKEIDVHILTHLKKKAEQA